MMASSSQRLTVPLGTCFAKRALISGVALKFKCSVRPVARKLRPSTALANRFCRFFRAALRPSSFGASFARALSKSHSSSSASAQPDS